MATYSIAGLPVEMLRDGYTEGAGRSGLTGTIGWLCDWNNRYAIANSLLGLPTGSGVGFTLPGAMPHPASPAMLCTEVRIAGAGKHAAGANGLIFDFAKIYATYGVPTWSQPNTSIFNSFDPENSLDPTQPYVYCQQSLSMGGEWMTLQGSDTAGNYGFAFSNGDSITKDLAVYVPHNVLTLKLFHLPYLPWYSRRIKSGTLNASALWNCPAETLRFEGAETTRTATTDGRRTQEVTYKFMNIDFQDKNGNPVTWQMGWNPKAKAWQDQVYSGTSTKIFKTGDLTQLLPTAYRA